MKLTMAQVHQIRKEAKALHGYKTMAQLQQEYHVSYETIHDAIAGSGAYRLFTEDPARAEYLAKATGCMYDRSQPKEQPSQDTTRTKNITMYHFYGKGLMTDSGDIDAYMQEVMRKHFHVNIGAPETQGMSTACLCDLLYMCLCTDLLNWQTLSAKDMTIEEAEEPIVTKLSNSSKRTIGVSIAHFFENMELVNKTAEKANSARADYLFRLLIKRWVKELAQESPNIPMLREVYKFKDLTRGIRKDRGICSLTGKHTAIYTKLFFNKSSVDVFRQGIHVMPNPSDYAIVDSCLRTYNPKY